MNKKIKERREGWMRIPVLIVSGIVLEVWGYLIVVLIIINFFNTIFTGKRLKDISKLTEIWNTQVYVFLRYIGFVTNERPFPFEKLGKNISKFK